MTIPGAGGQPPPRIDQQYPGSTPVPVSPGGQPLARVTQIIVTPGGVLQGIFTYSSNPPAAGTLIESASVISAGVDKYGNNFLAGHSSYGSGFATSVQAGQVAFYTGSLSGGWTFEANIQVSVAGLLILEAASTLISDNLEVGSNLTVDGTLSVGGSSDTGTPSTNSTSNNGLTDGTIGGTSGAASAGTAHTHGPGSFSVNNGHHTHDLQNHFHAL